MSWHDEALVRYRKEIAVSAVFVVLVSLSTALWHFVLGHSFEWQSISPIDQPSILQRTFYSALTFGTLGAYLYYCTNFYRKLYDAFARGRRDKSLHRGIKKVIWLVLMGVVFVAVGLVVSFLNTVMSLLYNLSLLALYMAPPVATAAALTTAGYFLIRYLRSRASPPLESQ